MDRHDAPWAPEAPALDDPPELRRRPGPGSILYFAYRPVLFLAEVRGRDVLAALVDAATAEDGSVTEAYVAIPVEGDEAQAVMDSRMSVREAYALRPGWAFHESRDVHGRPTATRAWEGIEIPLDRIALPGTYLDPDGPAP